MARTLGILAHVDAGKTTLSERLLHRTGAIRSLGRVDYGSTALDVNDIERERGVTVFCDQAWFTLGGERFTLLDTPGHVDFTGETERALPALDMAVLLLDGGAGVQPHTTALYELATAYRVPLIFFINKVDLPAFDRARVEGQIAARLSERAVRVTNGAPDMEQLAVLDDGFCERYLAGEASVEDAWNALTRLFAARQAFPLMEGAALSGAGVDALLDAIRRLAAFPMPTSEGLDALVYKVRREANGERVCFLRLQGGVLRPRAAVQCGDTVEKVHQIRLYRGASYTPVEEAGPGDAVGVTGLALPQCGDRLVNGVLHRRERPFHTLPVLSVRVEPPQGVTPTALLEKLRLLEDEEPLLSVAWDEAHGVATVQALGAMYVEILDQLLRNRFGMAARFLPPLALYRETLAAPVVGCGHYEPLRHYAEAHLLLSPGERGSGITFDSRCHVDDLPASYQSLIRTHVLEKVHKGVLTGSPLTDVRVTLLSGRAHLKHTEGGDFREAVYRAIRQGLMKGQTLLLEPFYRFTLTAPAEALGRVMTELNALCCACEPPEPLGEDTRLQGRGPVRTLMDYPARLRAATRGRGAIQLRSDGYDVCHNSEEVVAELAYDCGADVRNPAGSVFCSHGAGYFVPWDEADAHMHLPVEDAQK